MYMFEYVCIVRCFINSLNSQYEVVTLSTYLVVFFYISVQFVYKNADIFEDLLDCLLMWDVPNTPFTTQLSVSFCWSKQKGP